MQIYYACQIKSYMGVPISLQKYSLILSALEAHFIYQSMFGSVIEARFFSFSNQSYTCGSYNTYTCIRAQSNLTAVNTFDSNCISFQKLNVQTICAQTYKTKTT